MNVRPKKHLGQHFLIDKNIAEKIVNALKLDKHSSLLEIGPGKVLRGLLMRIDKGLSVINIEKSSDFDALVEGNA